jgi:type VI secretion system protein ImpF
MDEVNLVPSILDRLIDDEPKAPYEPVPKRFQSVSQLKKSVARDLEALLNTRQEMLDELPAEFVELRQALVVYGLPDFTSMNLLSHRDRNFIRWALEQTITVFEPRLTQVRVILENPRETDRALRFRVEALIQIEPASEPVTFDAVLHLSTQEYVVHG